MRKLHEDKELLKKGEITQEEFNSRSGFEKERPYEWGDFIKRLPDIIKEFNKKSLTNKK